MVAMVMMVVLAAAASAQDRLSMAAAPRDIAPRLALWLTELGRDRLPEAERRDQERRIVSFILAQSGGDDYLELSEARFQQLGPDLRAFIRQIARRRRRRQLQQPAARKRHAATLSSSSSSSSLPPRSHSQRFSASCFRRSLRPFLESMMDFAAELEQDHAKILERETIIQEILAAVEDPDLAGEVAPNQHFSDLQWAALSQGARDFVIAAGRRERERRRRQRRRDNKARRSSNLRI